MSFVFVVPAHAGESGPIAPSYYGLEPIGPTQRLRRYSWPQSHEFDYRAQLVRELDFASYRKDGWILEKIPRNFSYLDRTTVAQRTSFVLEFLAFTWKNSAREFFNTTQVPKNGSFKFDFERKYPPIEELEDFARKWFQVNLIIRSGTQELVSEQALVREAILDSTEFCDRLDNYFEAVTNKRLITSSEAESRQRDLLNLLGYRFDAFGNPVLDLRKEFTRNPRLQKRFGDFGSNRAGEGDFSFSGTRNVLILVDCSGSMSKELDTTKELLSRLVTKMPPELNCGIRIFGNGTSDPMLCCKATDLLRPLSPNPREILKFVPKLQAGGQASNVAYVLREALEKDLSGVTGKSVIILLSDGEDTCGESPPAQLYVLKHKNLTVPIVGVSTRFRWTKFSIVGNPLAKIAEITNGRYYDRDSYDIFVRDFESIRTK